MRDNHKKIMKTQIFLRRISELIAYPALSLTLAAPLSAAPGLTVERFTGVTGAQVSNLTSAAAFYSPTTISTVTSSVLPSNAGDNYGTRIRGYVTAPVTGFYTFWESGDDAVTLLLSPDENPANKQVIAFHTGFTNAQQWNKYSTQASRQILLTAGKKYYIEALHKEGAGADHLAIAWSVNDTQVGQWYLSSSTATNVFTNISLANCNDLTGTMSGSWISTPSSAQAFQITNNGNKLT